MSTSAAATQRLHEVMSSRLKSSGAPDGVAQLVLAAMAGPDAVEKLIDDGVVSGVECGNGDARATPVGAYISAISVEGFRGIGGRATLELEAGPGLTLVIGRNGSGKSTFAEGLEVLFTGDNPRWAKRSAVWREGWRNLHHPHTAIEARLAVEGHAGPTDVRRVWSDADDLESGTVEVQPHSEPKTDLSMLGWHEALLTYRPFLSYSELGATIDEGPTRLHDAVSAVLGLDELTLAEKALKDARLDRERARKAVLAERNEIVEILEHLDDERAGRCVAALRGTSPNLDVVEPLLVTPRGGETEGELGLLRRAAAYEFFTSEEVDDAVKEIVDAHAELAELAGTHADRLHQAADLLDRAVQFRRAFGDEDCPVCGTRDVLTDHWAEHAAAAADDHRAAAAHAGQAKRRRDAAISRTRELVPAVPQVLRDVRVLLQVEPLLVAWRELDELREIDDVALLAAELPKRTTNVRQALEQLHNAAGTEIDRRQDAWRPAALALASWVERARNAENGALRVSDLKAAEKWLKEAGEKLRNERFGPIADEAMEIWKLLRQQSNVELGRIELAGTGVRRRVALDVTVDGLPAAALGVMSQGELHALALSLFFPRATLDESPFRFIVVDDPVQSMDPSKVDGLAKVLERAAATRQVLVFTHDDRLPEAIRRLGINSTIIEVSRREQSRVDLRPALTPIERHVEDARILCATPNLPEEVARRVVPGFCRLAVEAGCIEAVRRRRIGRGELHSEVEVLLTHVTRLTVFAALALFDDPERGGDVLPRIASQFGNRAASAFQAANRGAHQGFAGELRDLVRDAAKLARDLAAQR